MEKGKWIFLVNKLPTEVAPPAMSIHYAIPWPMVNKDMEQSVEKQRKKMRKLLSRCSLIDEELLKETKDEDLWDFLENDEVYEFVEDNDWDLLEEFPEDKYGFAKSCDYRRLKGAMQIKFAGENIRVFPEEFTDVKLKSMKEYTEIFTFHPTDLWNGLGTKPTDPDEKFIFEAALLDGCDEYQANNIVSGGDIDSVDDFPPPLGWYECPMELGFYLGKTEEDMKPRYKETA